MSAQPTPFEVATDEAPDRGRAPLTLLPTPRPMLSGVGFGALIALLVAVGLALVMVVSTSVSAQSRELASLRKEATELGYVAAALTHELQSASSTSSLALRASDLGMVPNPYPAFISLLDGSILGEPTPVRGDEATYLRRLPQPGPVPDQLEVVVGQDTDDAVEAAPEAPDADAPAAEEPAPEAPDAAADGAVVLPASEEVAEE